MKLLVGDACSKTQIKLMESQGWGRMLTKANGQTSPDPYKTECMGFDNRAFQNDFSEAQFLKRLAKAEVYENRMIVAVVPDIVKGGMKSLELSNSWIKKLAGCNNFPWFLAVQDGMFFESVEKSVTSLPYKGIFLGGGDSFKNNNGRRYAALAKKYGLKFHYGRCGTPNKIRKAFALEADSCDSYFPTFWKPRVDEVVSEFAFQSELRQTVPLLGYVTSSINAISDTNDTSRHLLACNKPTMEVSQ